MTEPKDLLLVNEQLRRAKRRWKALALAACAALILFVVSSFVVAAWERMRFKRRAQAVMSQAVIEAQARDNQARVNAQRAANPGKPR